MDKGKEEFSKTANEKQKQQAAKWLLVKSVFTTFQTAPSDKRFHHLGVLFEHLSPFIEQGIRVAMLRHFLLLPSEMVLARVFAKSARRREMHHTHQAYYIWIEAMILHDLSDPQDELGVVNGAQGEPSAELQQKFNQLPYQDRALLYLYMVEKNSLADVAEQTDIPIAEVAAALHRIWRTILSSDRKVQVPLGWKIPDLRLLRSRGTSQGKDQPAE